MSKERPFKCEVPGCPNDTSRLPHVCTKHFIEGWGRLEDKPLPTTVADIEAAIKVLDEAPMPTAGSLLHGLKIMADKPKKKAKKRGKR